MHDPDTPTTPAYDKAAHAAALAFYKPNQVTKTASTPKAKVAVQAKAPVVLSSHTTPVAHKPLPNVPVTKAVVKPAVPARVAPVKTPQQLATEAKMRQYAANAAAHPYDKQATAAVDAELNPNINALQRQIDALNGTHNSEVANANARQARAQSDLSTLYSHLGNYTKGLQGVQDTNYGTAERAVGDNFAQLQQQLGQNFGAQKAATGDELSRLGINAVAPEATASLGRDQTYLQGLANVHAGSAQNNLEGQRSGFDALMQMMQGNAATTGVVQQGQSARDAAKVLADLNSAYNTHNTDLLGQKGDIQATRGTKIQQTIDALTHQATADKQAAEAAAFSRALAEANLGVKQGSLSVAQENAARQAGLTDAQIRHLANSDSVAQQNANTTAAKAAQAAAAAKAGKPAKLNADQRINALFGGYHDPEKQDVFNEFNAIKSGNFNNTPDPKTGRLPVDPNTNKPLGQGAFNATDPTVNAHLRDWLKRNTTKNLKPADVDFILRAINTYNGK